MKFKEYQKQAAPLMVFLHGGGVSGWMWDEQIRYFSKKYHCLVPDLPGHGSSKDEEFTIKGSAEEIIALINERRTGEKVIVIGFSLGAQILVQMLSEKSSPIDYAIINSALTKPMKTGFQLLRPLFRLSLPLVKMKSFAKLQSKVLYINENQFELYYKESKDISFDSFMQVMADNMSFVIPSGYSNSKANILVTVGEKEKRVMRKSAEELVQKHQNSKGIIIPRIGHGISLGDPNYFNQMVDNWISSGNLPTNAKMID